MTRSRVVGINFRGKGRLPLAELHQILKQKSSRPAANNMKGHAALVEPSELHWSEALLTCNGCNRCAGISVVARYEYGLAVSRHGRMCAKLFCRQVIVGLYEACSNKGIGDNFGREKTSQLFWSNLKSIRNVDNDLAVPIFKLLRNIFVSRKGNSEEDDLGFISVLKGLGNNAGTDIFLQRRKRRRSTRVCDADFDVVTGEGSSECGTYLAG